MKYIVTVEERVSLDFVVEANSAEKAQDIIEEQYKNGKIILEPGNCIGVTFTVNEER